MRWLLWLVLASTGCAEDLVLQGACEGQLHANRSAALRLVGYFGGEPHAVDALTIVDGHGRPSSFVGAALLDRPGGIEVYSGAPAQGYIGVTTDGGRQLWFQLVISNSAPEPTDVCPCTFEGDAPR